MNDLADGTDAQHQDFEKDWWGDCTNTMAEEAKQITYAHRMGLVNNPQNGQWPVFDLEGQSILDIGGGPVSMLLKTVNGGDRLTVVDPCEYPAWTNSRYDIKGIRQYPMGGEQYTSKEKYDEVWIYNVLQHVVDPQKIIENAKNSAKSLRIFEWVYLEPHLGHPHKLLPELLDEWIAAPNTLSKDHDKGIIEDMRGEKAENGCNAIAYYGHFDFTKE